jgi:hypothetical protein
MLPNWLQFLLATPVQFWCGARHHASGCVQQAVRLGDGDAAIDELMEVVERFAR